jgi:hypothetical protein
MDHKHLIINVSLDSKEPDIMIETKSEQLDLKKETAKQEIPDAWDPVCSGCHCLFAMIYMVWWILGNVIPIWAQIKGINVLTNRSQHFNGNPIHDATIHFQLLLNGYVILYLCYLVGRFVWLNWNSPNDCQRHLAQLIGGLIVFKLMYEAIRQSYYLAFGRQSQPFLLDPSESLPHGILLQCIGQILLLAFSLGLSLPFLLVRFFAQIYKHWASDNLTYRRIAQTVGLLVVGKIWWEVFKLARRWAWDVSVNREYTVNDYWCMVLGHLVLTVWTAGLYVYYLMWWYGMYWVGYPMTNYCTEPQPCLSDRAIQAGYPPKLELLHDSMLLYGVGVFLLICCTGGLYLPFFIVETLYRWWYSNNWWKQQIAQTICGLVIFKLWYEVARQGYIWVYVNPRSYSWTEFILGHLGLAVATLGLFVPFRCIELYVLYFAFWWNLKTHAQSCAAHLYARGVLILMSGGILIPFFYAELVGTGIQNVNNNSPMTEKYNTGVVQLSVTTLGIYAIYHYLSSPYRWIRYTLRALLLCGNALAYWVIYLEIQQHNQRSHYKQGLYRKMMIATLAVVNYAVYLLMVRIIYSENVRTACWKVRVYAWLAWRGICHALDYCKHKVFCGGIWFYNRVDEGYSFMRTQLSRCYASFWNEALPRWSCSHPIHRGDANYVTETVVLATPAAYPVLRSYDTKIQSIMENPQFVLKQKITRSIQCIEATIHKLWVIYNNRCQWHPTQQQLFWARRFDRYLTEDELCADDIKMSQFCITIMPRGEKLAHMLPSPDDVFAANQTRFLEYITKLQRAKIQFETARYNPEKQAYDLAHRPDLDLAV